MHFLFYSSTDHIHVCVLLQTNASLYDKKHKPFFCHQMESGQGDLGTLANVVTSLANLSDSLKENLNNGDTSDSRHEEQNASEITRSVITA